MTVADSRFGPEWSLLELITHGLRSDEQKDEFTKIMGSYNIDWGELLEQALRHKVLPLLAFHVTASECEQYVPRFVKLHLRTALDYNRHKTKIFRLEAAKVVTALNERQVPVVGRKGIVFESTLYGGNGSRNLNEDIDFMTPPEYHKVVIEVMSELGYQMGYFDWKSAEPRPHRRADAIRYQLSPDHIPAFVIMTGDPVIRSVSVDFATSFTWISSPFDVPIEEAFKEVNYQEIPGVSEVELPSFSPQFRLLCTVSHLFREAWFDSWLTVEQDVNLMKFGDVLRLWMADRKSLQNGSLVQTIEKYGVVDPVVWVLEHLDRTFQTDIVQSLQLGGRVSEQWMAGGYVSTGRSRTWRGTMRMRLHSKDRRQLFSSTD